MAVGHVEVDEVDGIPSSISYGRFHHLTSEMSNRVAAMIYERPVLINERNLPLQGPANRL